MDKLPWQGRMTIMGTLAAAYRVGGPPRLIRYVTLEDAQRLQVAIRTTAEKEAQIAQVRTRIKRLREAGYTDERIDGVMSELGGSLKEFERQATTWPELQIRSYRLDEDPLFDTYRAVFERLHSFQPRDFAAVELAKRGTVQAL